MDPEQTNEAAASIPQATTAIDNNPPKYVPQFSAATEMILKRINSGASASNLTAISNSGPTVAYTGGSAKYEDMRRSVLMGMKTSMNMEMPPIAPSERQKKARENKTKRTSTTPGATPSASGSAKGKTKGKGRAKTGGKRKRTQESESLSEEEEESDGEMSQLGGDSDDEDGGSVASLPKITQSGRQVNKPSAYVPASYEPSPKKRGTQSQRKQEQALCKRCGRGNSPDKNMIVFCDGCNLCWHQLCHDPVITEETVKDEVSPWFCTDCSKKRGGGGKQTAADQRGVSWQGRSAEDKRNYFTSLPHHQLVSLLMQATILHPNVPIFPAPPTYMQNKANNTKSAAQTYHQSAASAAGLFTRSESNPRASMNFIRKIPSGQSATPSPAQATPYTPPVQTNVSAAAEDSRESTPASPAYPKPGNGLMAKLGPDEEDNEWLVDADGDFEAFSHTLYDDTGVATQTGGIVATDPGSLLDDAMCGTSDFNAAFNVGNANPGAGVNGVGAIHGHGL